MRAYFLLLYGIVILNLGQVPGINPKLCAINTTNITISNYQSLLNHIETVLLTTNTQADNLLCISTNINSPCYRIWQFKSISDIPQSSLYNECGEEVIKYTEE